MWYNLLFAVLFTVATANVVYNGQCPELTPVPNFNNSAWAETWYVNSMYSDNQFLPGTCQFARFTYNGSVFQLQFWYVDNNVQKYFEGTATAILNANNNAKFLGIFKFGNVYINHDADILATDYTNYAILYLCIYDAQTNKHQVLVLILSRKKTLEGKPKVEVDDFVACSNVLDASLLVPNDFSDEACGFDSTESLSYVCPN